MRNTSSKLARASSVLPMLATAVVLGALLVDRSFLRVSPAEAEGYHAAVRTAAEALPPAFGSWLGVDVPVPEAAVKMLHPNKIVSRRFRNVSTNETVTLLLVHVRDARDILGHYPPVCYPAQGWKLEAKLPVDWAFNERVVRGTEYEFSRDDVAENARLVVDNFLVARGGDTARDMDGIEVVAQDRRRKFFGAAQVQIVQDGSTSSQRRSEIVEEFIGYVGPTLRAVSEGGAK